MDVQRGRRHRPWQVFVTLVLATAAATAGGHAIYALFTSTPTATIGLTVEEPVIPRPATVSCVTQGSILARWAHFSWTAPSGAPQPSEYVIRILDQGVEVEVERVPGSQTSADVTSGLLGVITGLLNLLLLGETRPATVNAAYGPYESPSEWTHHIRNELGLLGAIGCGEGSAPAGFAPAEAPTTTISPSTTTTVPPAATSTTTGPATTSTTTTTSTTIPPPPATTTTTSTVTSTALTTTTSTATSTSTVVSTAPPTTAQ